MVVSPVKAILAIAVRGGERLACLEAEAVDDVEHARRQQVADEVGPEHDRRRGLLGGLQNHAVAGRERGGQFPDRHEQREVPRDDLADDAERLVEVIGDGVVVDLGEAAFLGADRAGEVAEVIDGQRQVGGGRLADRLAVVPGFGAREEIEVLLHAVSDPVEDQRALGRAGAAPGVLGGMGRVERGLDVLGVGTGDFAEKLAVYRREVLEITCLKAARSICRQ